MRFFDKDKIRVPKLLCSYIRMVRSSNVNRITVHTKVNSGFYIPYKRMPRDASSRQNLLLTISLGNRQW